MLCPNLIFILCYFFCLTCVAIQHQLLESVSWFFFKVDYVKVKACSGITLFSLSVDTKIPEESRNVKHDLLITKQILKKEKENSHTSDSNRNFQNYKSATNKMDIKCFFQLCTLLFGDTSNDDLKKYFEEVVAPFAIVNQRQDDTQEGDVDHMLTCGESVLDKFKEDIADFILNGVREEVSE